MTRRAIHARRAWYFESAVKPTFSAGQYDEVSFGHYDGSEGPTGEGRIVFYRFSLSPGRSDSGLELCVFSDGFAALSEDVSAFIDRFASASGNNEVSPETVLAWLVSDLGYVDATEEVGPYGKAAAT